MRQSGGEKMLHHPPSLCREEVGFISVICYILLSQALPMRLNLDKNKFGGGYLVITNCNLIVAIFV